MNLPRRAKHALWLLLDVLLVPLSLYFAFALRFGTPTPSWAMTASWALFPALMFIGLAACVAFDLHKVKLHALERFAMLRIGVVAIVLALSAIVLSYLLGTSAPRSVPLIFGVVFFCGALALRMAVLATLTFMARGLGTRAPVAIYGAGSAGIQLVSALRQSSEVKPVVFVDDNPTLRGLIVSGLKVQSPDTLEAMIAKGKIERVLLAMPSISRSGQDIILKRLAALKCGVQVLPSYVDLIVGKGSLANLRTVTPDELLGRDKVDLDIPDVAKVYAGRNVMVTGAGGSIGSELCRQLIGTAPAHIVLFERSELALYQIDRELRPLADAAGIKVTTRLGSVTDAPRVQAVMAETDTEIVLHAAAYKHVPLVEENELEGARNNVLGTQVVAEAAQAAGVERFILISTDKAVRPTNIMGATKRMAELVVQDLQTRSTGTKFSMVRFGNVLGSSGSVLPLFEQQIRRGGPVTVTHAEVTRFFMTIPEAARLVLLAGAYAKGGDVFVLDMGEAMKILDIAKRMIELSGRTVRENGVGDIEVKITGLRPGEKLFEELLIDDDSLGATPHEKILRAEEAMLSQIEVASMLRELGASLERGDTAALRALVEKRVDGYHRQENVAVG
ncbi:polysaccharide biosynthesis protein [Planktotalea frisia]|uniref:polysaccharide biosynthesis protein n=1 Tax=Planktotalea frisia TaxID=696762 RepID=UPI0023537917|nr:nucleoside-diphosphate sugar epimerase/dehydratase [Planktotalea frisia]